MLCPDEYVHKNLGCDVQMYNYIQKTFGVECGKTMIIKEYIKLNVHDGVHIVLTNVP